MDLHEYLLLHFPSARGSSHVYSDDCPVRNLDYVKSSVLLTFDHSASDLINHKETKPEYLWFEFYTLAMKRKKVLEILGALIGDRVGIGSKLGIPIEYRSKSRSWYMLHASQHRRWPSTDGILVYSRYQKETLHAIAILIYACEVSMSIENSVYYHLVAIARKI